MAQFLTLLPVLLFVATFNPIVCPSSHFYNERRDRAPYIGSSEHSHQYLDAAAGPAGGRLRKPPFKDHNSSYRSHEQLSHPYNNPSTAYEQVTTDSIVDKSIRSVFSTNFGPGLHLFKNTAPHFKLHTDQMISDQPDTYTSPSLSSSTSTSSSSPSSSASGSKEFFKVQRSPNGKLSVVYNEDYKPKVEKDKQGSGSSGSYNKSFENKFQTHFPGGHHSKKDKIETSPAANIQNKDSVIYFPTDEPDKDLYTVNTNDCVGNEGPASGKPFCTNLSNYPEKTHLEKIIKEKFSNLESFFGEDLVIPQNISQRMNNVPDEEFLCRSRIRVIYPKAGENKDYNWLLIVNLPNYKQGIRIEECINEGEMCGESSGLSLPNHYTATCKQSYIYRSMVALTTNETVIKDQFRMPSCCKCVLKVVTD